MQSLLFTVLALLPLACTFVAAFAAFVLASFVSRKAEAPYVAEATAEESAAWVVEIEASLTIKRAPTASMLDRAAVDAYVASKPLVSVASIDDLFVDASSDDNGLDVALAAVETSIAKAWTVDVMTRTTVACKAHAYVEASHKSMRAVRARMVTSALRSQWEAQRAAEAVAEAFDAAPPTLRCPVSPRTVERAINVA